MTVTALKQGRRIVGTLIRLVRNPAIARAAGQAGLDFVMFNVEYGSYSLDVLSDISLPWRTPQGWRASCACARLPP